MVQLGDRVAGRHGQFGVQVTEPGEDPPDVAQGVQAGEVSGDAGLQKYLFGGEVVVDPPGPGLQPRGGLDRDVLVPLKPCWAKGSIAASRIRSRVDTASRPAAWWCSGRCTCT